MFIPLLGYFTVGVKDRFGYGAYSKSALKRLPFRGWPPSQTSRADHRTSRNMLSPQIWPSAKCTATKPYRCGIFPQVPATTAPPNHPLFCHQAQLLDPETSILSHLSFPPICPQPYQPLLRHTEENLAMRSLIELDNTWTICNSDEVARLISLNHSIDSETFYQDWTCICLKSWSFQSQQLLISLQ